MLFDSGGDDDYGVMRDGRPSPDRADGESPSLGPHPCPAEIVLYGPFYQVPHWLYFRREHSGQNGHAPMRRRCANMDPRRANRWRHPAVRLYGEYVWAYVSAIRRAPLSAADQRDCYRHLAQWLASQGAPVPADRTNLFRWPTRTSRSTPWWLAARGDFRELAAAGQGETAMSNSAGVGGPAHESAADHYKRDFWIKENQKHVPVHYRLQKSARIINTNRRPGRARPARCGLRTGDVDVPHAAERPLLRNRHSHTRSGAEPDRGRYSQEAHQIRR